MDPRRFKGPVGSPLIVPILTLESSASRSRPHRIGRFRRRAISRRFVPHPRKMANMRRLVLAKASHTHTNRRGRLVQPTAGSAPWVQFPQTRRSACPFQAPRKNSVCSSRPRSPAFAGLVLAGRNGSCQSPPSVRAQNSAPTAVGTCHAPCFNGPPAPQKSAAGGPDQRCFPPSVSPLWNPPFLIPPSNSNTPKGENRRGQQRGVSTGAAEETAGPLSPRGAAPRRPSGCQCHSAACPPCAKAPEGVGAKSGRGGLVPHTSPALQCVRKLTHFCGYALAPLRLITPGGGGRIGFAAARRPRAEERLQNNDGEVPIPPWRRACCPAAGNRSGHRGHPFHRVYFWQPTTAHYATGQRISSLHR
jgi:hypothetical protein